MSIISEQFKQVNEQIDAACQEFNREIGSVALLAVSKKKPASDLLEAYKAGQHAFGENYLQEALEKIDALKELPLEWHFIGPIQSNKTAAIAQNFHWVHSVDRLKIAQRLNDQRPTELPPLKICLQVNISGEASKSGCTLEQLTELAAEVSKLPNLRLRGLMAIPESGEQFEEQRKPFAEMKKLLTQLQIDHPEMDTLSMGMSGDLRAAICEGATMVRIGTALFGRRDS